MSIPVDPKKAKMEMAKKERKAESAELIFQSL
jgi:hypothetical protein